MLGSFPSQQRRHQFESDSLLQCHATPGASHGRARSTGTRRDVSVTLILNQTGWRCAVQVSDRLVSVMRGSTTVPFDPQSNKTILLITGNGILSLSYSGLSYIVGTPTDNWLVEQIRGRPPERQPDGSLVMAQISTVQPSPTLQTALERMRISLEGALNGRERAALRKAPIAVVGTGWLLYRRKPPRPVLVWLVPNGHGYETVWARRIYGNNCLSLPVPDGYLSIAERNALTATYVDRTPDELEGIMVSTIRNVAGKAGGVGRDCMSVVITSPMSPPCYVRVRFIPHTQTFGNPGTGDSQSETPVAFSPWIISPGMYFAPTMMTAGTFLSLRDGDYRIRFEGIPADPAIVKPDEGIAISSQLRPPPP